MTTNHIKTVVQEVIPVMSLTEAIKELVSSDDHKLPSKASKDVLVAFLEDMLENIHLFSDTPELMTVVSDVLNYESECLTTRFASIINLKQIIP